MLNESSLSNNKMPKGIPYIIGNELSERFSYYGMKTILVSFMTLFLMNSAGEKDVMSPEDSKVWYHTFIMANYFFPILGALLSDILWGKYRTIITLSIIYCLGHLALSLDETRLGLSLGLTMIAIGSGGIKPCVSAHVGDQFSFSNKHLLEKVFNLFYLAINIGAAISSLLTPLILREYGPAWAFGFPGALMIIATFLFWLGRKEYTTVPPAGWAKYKKEFADKEVVKGLLGLLLIYLFMSIFWSLYEQTGSSWVLQAQSEYMNKTIDLGFTKFDLYPDQLQSLNPILILIFVPSFAFILYPQISKIYKLTPLRKITIGMFVCALSFVIIAYVQTKIDAKIEVSIWWQALAYVVLTISEILVYGTGLEFSYTQAPNSMKSLVMGLFLLSVSFGNFITALVNKIIQNADGTNKLEGAEYFWFFATAMIITAAFFILVAQKYKEKTYIQGN